MVSILVLMDLPFLQNMDTFIRLNVEDVSILVLMDLPFLQKKTKREWTEVKWRFNPCSYGSSVLTVYSAPIALSIWRFQSLFLWIFRSYVLNKLTISTFKVEFQSLFLWIFRSYLVLIFLPFQNILAVSILVLMDLPFLH